MGVKDTPPLCVSSSPLQSPGGFMTEKTRSFSMSSAASSSSSLSSASTSSCSSTGSSSSTYHRPSPIRYVPPCKTRVNLTMQCPSPSVTRVDRAAAAGSSDSASVDCSRDGNVSPIRAYIDCLTPQSLKCAVVGDTGVGKTSLLMSYMVDKFPDTHSPTIYDKLSTSITVNGKRISVTMCDTAGQDDFAHLRPLCYPQVDVALICFSVVDIASYENVRTKWIREIRQHCPGIPVMIVGTQTDLRSNTAVLKQLKSQGKRPLTKSDGTKLAAQCKASCYIECSALTQQNVKSTFDEAIAAGLEMNSSSSKHTPQCAGCTIL